MSYVRLDDAHDDGQLSAFRERLSAEIRMQTGEDFPIFQDRNDVAWGQNWQRRIDEALAEVTLLLVIVTPGLFRSPACRDEVARFREHERKLGRDDLILPVYYVAARQIDDPDLRDADDMARLLWSRQYADWRELRFEPLTSPVVRKAVAQLASRMTDSFWQQPATPVAPVKATSRSASSSAMRTDMSAGPSEPRRDTTRTEPPTHVVDLYERGDFVSVGAAIEAARPGDRILVRPGLYRESLTIDKPLELIGDGPLEDIEIRAWDARTLLFRASIGRVANLTLRQAGGKSNWYCVVISQGRLDLEGCDISSRGPACVAIHDGADPRLRRNKIHDGSQTGVYVYEGGLGTLEDNEITGHDSGVAISTAGDPVLRRNQIHDNEQSGVFVAEGGLGTLEDNEITANGRAGVEIEAGDSTIRGNRINRNGYKAVWIYAGGKAVVEDNDLTGNAGGAWGIARDCEPNVTRARNKE
jgi:F-box protein 11